MSTDHWAERVADKVFAWIDPYMKLLFALLGLMAIGAAVVGVVALVVVVVGL